jgi:HSP20 family protein
MARKEVKEWAKNEGSRVMTAPWDMEKWADDFFWKPFSIVGFPSPRSFKGEELVPSVDIFEENGEVVLKAEIPGIKKEDIDITLTEDTITLSGEKNKEKEVKKKDYYRWECSYGSFSCMFSLPAEAQADKVKTKFKDGILEIRMPKTEEAKKKEVKVKVQ